MKGNVQSLLSKSVDHENAFITYRNHLTERDAVQSRINNVFQDSKRLAESIPIVSSIIDCEMKSLSHDWNNFSNELKSFHEDLDDTKDSEALKDDLVNIEEWIDANEATFGNFDGSSLDEIEEMLRMQDDFEKSIAVQEGRFQSTLGRLSKYTEKVENKYTKRMSIGDASMSVGDASMSIESLNLDGIEDGRKELVLEHEIKHLQPPNDKERKETNERIKPSSETRTERSTGDANFADKLRNQGSSHRNQPENVMKLEKPRQLHEEKVHDFGIKNISSPDRLGNHDISLREQPGNVVGLEKPKTFRGEKVHDKPGRDRNVDSLVQTAIPDNKEIVSATFQKVEGVDSGKKTDITGPKNTLDFKHILVDEKNNEEGFKTDSFADKLLTREKSLSDNNAAARIPLVDSSTRVIDDSESEEITAMAELSPVADGASGKYVPHVVSCEDTSQSLVASKPKEIESTSRKTMTDRSDSGPRDDFTDADIIPEQVLVTESSVDFAFLDDDFDDAEEIPIRVEQSLEKDVDFLKPLLKDKEDFEMPKDLDIFWDDVSDDEEADSEDQRIVNVAPFSSTSKDVSSHGVEDGIYQHDETSNLVPGNSPREESHIEGRTKDPEHLDNEHESESKPGSSEDSNKSIVNNFPFSTEGGNVELRSHVPAILVSHPSGTEDDIKQLLNPEASHDRTVTFAGNLELKEETVYKEKRTTSRKWKDLHVIIIGSSLICYDSEDSFRKNAAPREEMELEDAMISVEPGMLGDTLRLVIGDKSEYVVRSNDADRFNRFLMAVSKCSNINSKEDTISLPPAPPPPTMPVAADGNSINTDQTQSVEFPETNSRNFENPESEGNLPDFEPPEIVSDGMLN